MDPKPSSPPYSEYSNAQLEEMLNNPDLSQAEKDQVRNELTRRLRDDLLKAAQNVADSRRRQKRRGRILKTSRLFLILVVLALCGSAALCVYVLAPPDWLPNLTQFIQPLLALFSG